MPARLLDAGERLSARLTSITTHGDWLHARFALLLVREP